MCFLGYLGLGVGGLYWMRVIVHNCTALFPKLLSTHQIGLKFKFLDPEGSQSATTVIGAGTGVVVIVFEKCLRLC